MAGLAILALVVSALLFGSMLAVLILLRRGERPTFRATRRYEANRREAIRVLLGDEVERVPGEQWYDPRRKTPSPGDPLAAPFREAVAAALAAVGPGTWEWEAGSARIGADRVVAALSTADLRAAGIERGTSGERLTIGIVLFNPEPPGDDPQRVVLPAQVLFPALARARREDLVRRFEELSRRALHETRRSS